MIFTNPDMIVWYNGRAVSVEKLLKLRIKLNRGCVEL